MFNLQSLKKLFSQLVANVMSIPTILRNTLGFNRTTLLLVLLVVILYLAYRHHFIADLAGDVTSGVDMVLDTVGVDHGSSQVQPSEPEGYEPGAYMAVN